MHGIRSALAALAGVFAPATAAGAAGDGYTDAGMNEGTAADAADLEAASVRARASLPRFLSLHHAGLQGSYLLKMSLSDSEGTEHIWMQVSDFRDGVFAGHLANEPTTRGRRLGDPVSLRIGDVEDWMINTGKARYGGYTVRVLTRHMPRGEADALRAQFRD